MLIRFSFFLSEMITW